MQRPASAIRPVSAVRRDGVSREEYEKLEVDVDHLTERVADLEVARTQSDGADVARKCQRMEEELRLMVRLLSLACDLI